MSTIVVTPPAAAVAVARATPSPGALPVCTCASTWPGSTSCPSGTSMRSSPLKLPRGPERGDASVARCRSRPARSAPRAARNGRSRRGPALPECIGRQGCKLAAWPRAAIIQIDSEHPSKYGLPSERWSARLQRRLEAASGRPVEVVPYLEARELSEAHAIVISGSAAPWAAHDPAALDRLGEVGHRERPARARHLRRHAAARALRGRAHRARRGARDRRGRDRGRRARRPLPRPQRTAVACSTTTSTS